MEFGLGRDDLVADFCYGLGGRVCDSQGGFREKCQVGSRMIISKLMSIIN